MERRTFRRRALRFEFARRQRCGRLQVSAFTRRSGTPASTRRSQAFLPVHERRIGCCGGHRTIGSGRRPNHPEALSHLRSDRHSHRPARQVLVWRCTILSCELAPRVARSPRRRRSLWISVHVNAKGPDVHALPLGCRRFDDGVFPGIECLVHRESIETARRIPLQQRNFAIFECSAGRQCSS